MNIYDAMFECSDIYTLVTGCCDKILTAEVVSISHIANEIMRQVVRESTRRTHSVFTLSNRTISPECIQGYLRELLLRGLPPETDKVVYKAHASITVPFACVTGRTNFVRDCHAQACDNTIRDTSVRVSALQCDIGCTGVYRKTPGPYLLPLHIKRVAAYNEIDVKWETHQDSAKIDKWTEWMKQFVWFPVSREAGKCMINCVIAIRSLMDGDNSCPSFISSHRNTRKHCVDDFVDIWVKKAKGSSQFSPFANALLVDPTAETITNICPAVYYGKAHDTIIEAIQTFTNAIVMDTEEGNPVVDVVDYDHTAWKPKNNRLETYNSWLHDEFGCMRPVEIDKIVAPTWGAVTVYNELGCESPVRIKNNVAILMFADYRPTDGKLSFKTRHNTVISTYEVRGSEVRGEYKVYTVYILCKLNRSFDLEYYHGNTYLSYVDIEADLSYVDIEADLTAAELAELAADAAADIEACCC